MKFIIAFAFVLLAFVGTSFAQSGNDFDGNQPPPSSRDMGTPGEASPFKSKKSFFRKKKNKHKDEPERLIKEYHERMEANQKRNKKMAKEMKKPQYADPLYFGHKKKPKKRPVGKRKFCDECGMVH